MLMTTPAPSDKLVTIDDAKLQIAVWLQAHPEKQNDRLSPVGSQACDVLLSWGIDDEDDTHVDQLTVDQILIELADSVIRGIAVQAAAYSA